MKRSLAVRLTLFAALLAVLPFSGRAIAQQEEPSSPRAKAPLTLLQLNDVYSTTPVDGLGGLARVATIKQRLRNEGRTPLLVLAGDFLSPSVPSSIFKGAQMVAALNAAGLDLATLGNHEFDFGPDVLRQRMAEATWTWVVSNVIDTATGRPVGNAAPYVVRTFGALKVGFIGLCLTGSEIAPDRRAGLRLVDPMEAAAVYLPVLQQEGVDAVVAITHLTFDEDRALAQRFPDIDVIVGGHEHYPITAQVNRTLITKSGSDAKLLARVDLNRPAAGPVDRFFELMPVTAAIPDEPRTAAVVDDYEARLGAELDVVVGSSRVDLDADTVRLRGQETNLGNLFADAARAAVQADVAIVNAGGIRGDRVYPAGPLTRRTLLAVHPFGDAICKVAVSGRVLVQALENGVSRMPRTDGRFPQVSGLAMRVDPNEPAGARVSEVIIGGRPVDPDRLYTVALSDYQLNGGDGYGMFAGQRVLIDPESGPLFATALEAWVRARGDVSPAVEGRIRIAR